MLLFSQECSSAIAEQTSTSSSADQTLSPSVDQTSASSSVGQTSASSSADETSTSPSTDQKSPLPFVEQTFPSPSADQTPLSHAADQRSPSPSFDQTSPSSSADQTSASSSATQTYPPPCANQRFPSSSSDQTFLSSATDQRFTSPFFAQTSSSSYADQTSTLSSANQTYPLSCANQRFPSSLADQKSLSLSAEQRSPSLSADQRSTSSSASQTCFSLFANQTCFSLFADQTSLSLSTEQRSPSLSAEQRSTSSSACQTFFSLFADQTSLSPSGDQTSRFSTSNQTPNSSFADQRFPSSCADQKRSAEQKKSLSPFIAQTYNFSLFPDQECSSSTFLGQESSILPFGGQSNSSSAVYCQTKLRGSIFDSRLNVETSCVSRPTMETMDEAPRSHVSSPPCTMPSGPSECHTRPIEPTIDDTMFPMFNESPRPSTVRQSITSLYGPVSAAIRPLMSCDVRPPALSSDVSIQTTPPGPSSNVDFDTMFPAPTGCYIPASIFSTSGTYGNVSCIPGCVPTGPLMSCDVRPPAIPTLTNIPTTPPVPSSDVNFDIRFPTPTGYFMPSSASKTYGNTFSVPGSVTVGPLMSCDVRPTAIPSLMSIQTTPPVSSSNFTFDTKVPTPTGYSLSSSASKTYGNTFGIPGSVPTRPRMSCDVRPAAIPSLMSIHTTPPIPSSNVTFDTKFPTPTGYSMPSSASKTYGNTCCVPGSVPARPRMSCDVRPSAIPSLMSIQTTPPVPSSNVSFGSRYPTPTGYSMPSSASKTYGNTCCVPQSVPPRPLMSCDVRPPAIPSLMSIQTTPPVPSSNSDFVNNSFYTPTAYSIPSNIIASRTYENTFSVPGSVPGRPLMSSDVRPAVIPSLMSIQTSPPVPSNDIRFLRNTGNRRRVADSIATSIPSLMSIETRPPWEPRLRQPPG